MKKEPTGYPGVLCADAMADDACTVCRRPVMLAPWLPHRADDLDPDDIIFCGNCLAVCVLRGLSPCWVNPAYADIAERERFWAAGLEHPDLPPDLASAHLRNLN